MNVDLWLDERGRRCPIPVIALARSQTHWLKNEQSNAKVVGVLADDPAAQYDIPAWCRLKGAEFLGETLPPDEGAGTGYLVRFSS
jgi:TusA-related sulfurtransferase